MSRLNAWDRIWIPVKKRKPPEDPTKEILVWNYLWKKPIVMQASIARYSAIAMEKGDSSISSDRVYSHWCWVESPGKEGL